MLQTYTTGMLQAKAYRVLKNYLSSHLVSYGLSMPQWAFLGLVFENQPVRLSFIANRMEVEAPFATSLADQLYEKGLISRKEDKQDRRAKVISLTKKGSDLIPEVEANVKNAMRKIYTKITPQELGVYIKVLDAIVDVYTDSE